MRGKQLSTIGQLIQWAANKQIDLLHAYEYQHGFSSKADIWDLFCREIKQEFGQIIDAEKFNKELQLSILAYLVHEQSTYHLEMSTDEMAHAFLTFKENN